MSYTPLVDVELVTILCFHLMAAPVDIVFCLGLCSSHSALCSVYGVNKHMFKGSMFIKFWLPACRRRCPALVLFAQLEIFHNRHLRYIIHTLYVRLLYCFVLCACGLALKAFASNIGYGTHVRTEWISYDNHQTKTTKKKNEKRNI